MGTSRPSWEGQRNVFLMSLALSLGVQGTMNTDIKAWWRAAQPNILLLPDDVSTPIQDQDTVPCGIQEI